MFLGDNSLGWVFFNTQRRKHASTQSFDKQQKLLHVVYGGRTKWFRVFISRNQAVERRMLGLKRMSMRWIWLDKTVVISEKQDICSCVSVCNCVCGWDWRMQCLVFPCGSAVGVRGRAPPSVAVFRDPVYPPTVKNDVCPEDNPNTN